MPYFFEILGHIKHITNINIIFYNSNLFVSSIRLLYMSFIGCVGLPYINGLVSLKKSDPKFVSFNYVPLIADSITFFKSLGIAWSIKVLKKELHNSILLIDCTPNS